MGLADRDYVRSRPTTAAGGAGGGRGFGLGGRGMGGGPFKTVVAWLIAINIGVFILNNWVMHRVDTVVSAGRETMGFATPEMLSRAVIDRVGAPRSHDAGLFLYRPVYDPLTVAPDTAGKVVQAKEDGQVFAGVRVRLAFEWTPDSTPEQRDRAAPATAQPILTPNEVVAGAPAAPTDLRVVWVDRQTQTIVGTELVGSRLLVARDRELHGPPLYTLGHFSTGKLFSPFPEIWRLLTFQFLHAGTYHLLFNMLALLFFGEVVERSLGGRRFLAFYLVCGVFGALAYLALNLAGFLMTGGTTGVNPIPLLLVNDVYTPLIGASAGVFGVLVAAARLRPNETIYLMFAIPMKMWVAVALFTGLAAYGLLMVGRNQGGEAAHLGGAIAGWFLIVRPDLLADMFRIGGKRGGGARRPGSSAKPPRRPTSAPARRGKGKPADERSPIDDELDRILGKVNDSGLDSLSDSERQTLARSTERFRKQDE